MRGLSERLLARHEGFVEFLEKSDLAKGKNYIHSIPRTSILYESRTPMLAGRLG